jgi:uncharacterized protein YjbI with pentapeptide repeats
MKVIKNDNLSLLYSTFPRLPGLVEPVHGHALTVAALAGFSFAPNATNDLLLENALWQRISEALPDGEILDQGLPKPCGEYLVYGACCSRNPLRDREIHLRVGNLSKRLHVFGPRFWRDHGPSRPRPFTRIPVAWQHAFGGEAFPDNPLGLGHARIRGVHPLPLVENPDHLMAFARQKTPPAGLTAIPAHWPQRRRYLGSVDSAWLERDWPGLPSDYRAEHACCAPPDQRFPGYMQGGERFSITGMHPANNSVRGALPMMRARLFIQRDSNADNNFQEISCRLETLWLFPESETGIVLFRGVTTAKDEECTDIAAILADFENASGAPRSADHYRERCQHVLRRGKTIPVDHGPTSRQSPQNPDHYVPPGAAPTGVAAAATGAVLAENSDIKEIQAQVASLENEVAQHLDAIGVSNEQAEAFLQQAEPLTPKVASDLETPQDLMQELQETAQTIEAEVFLLLKRHGLTPEGAQLLLEKQTAAGQVGDEQFMHGLDHLLGREDLPEDVRAGIRNSLSGFQEVQAALAVIAAKVVPARNISELSRQLSSSADPTEPLTTVQALERHRLGLGLAGCDLTGCDFTGHDLTGADLRKAILNGVSWPGVVLARANLRGAFCRQADLTKADLTDANLSGAVLEKARLTQVKAQGCIARRARLQDADLRQASLRQADLQAADCSGADLRFADLKAVHGRDMRLNNAQLAQSQWNNADLRGSRADAGTKGEQACFAGANLEQVRWSGAYLPQADFSGANLDGADLSKSSLRKANFRLATARKARLTKADLRESKLREVNLFQASLRSADCTQAHIENVNLFGADLCRCKLDTKALKDVNLGRSILQPGILERMA